MGLRWRPGEKGRGLLTLALGSCLAACAAAGDGRSVVLPETAGQPVTSIDSVSDYERAIATIAAIFRRDLGFPAFPITFRFYPDREAFEAALVGVGYDPALASDTATTMGAIGGYRRVLINESTLVPLTWPARVGLLAHEMTHSLQYEWGGGRRGESDQWLREGFAEWVSLRVLERLGAVSMDDVRRQRRAELRRVRQPVRLDDMATFPQWVALSSRRGTAPYTQAFLAVDSLVQRHGLEAIAQYFQLFVLSRDRAANFRIAFGDELLAFERELSGTSR